MIRRIMLSAVTEHGIDGGKITEPPEREVDVEVIGNHVHLTTFKLNEDGTREEQHMVAVGAVALDATARARCDS